jgi:hypothetical protein
MPAEATLITTHYNLLPTVIDADQKLKSNDRDVALRTLSSVIVRHGLGRSLGIRLLHKHNDIADGEIMGEDIEIDNAGAFTLVTEPKNFALRCDEEWRANSWKLVKGSYVPLEFSRKDLLADTEISPSAQSQCFSELATVLRVLRLEHLLGPSVNVGPVVEAHRPSGDTILSEITDEEYRRNIVKFVDLSEVDQSKVIETAWYADTHADGPTLAQNCRTVCKRICPSVPGGGHKGTFQHNRPHE